jgi:hypothetical protein
MKLLPVVFEEREIRRVYDENTETWFFSVVDSKEGSQVVTDCHQFKLPAADGKMRLTDVASTEVLGRIRGLL